ncbi:MAG TPA: CNNM domain-containing protein, partial [candidate division Zixibacteria bacterium]|nr:CNNM domain-containing protein [candidate division Zixibacteria bacterium]
MNGAGSEVLVILALILANGFFALSELALVSARRSNLEEMKERGKKSARRALQLIDQPERVLAAVQVGITVVGTLASVYGGATVVEYLTPYLAAAPLSFVANHSNGFAVALVVIAISFLSITIGELAPKYLALAHAERIAAGVSWPMTQLTRLLRFVTPIFSVFARGIVRLFGVREVKPSSVVSEMDVRLLLAEGRESGVFDRDEEEIVRSALDFADTTAREA